MTTRKHLPSAPAFEMPLMTDTRKAVCNVFMVCGLGKARCGEAYEWTGISTLIAFPDIANSFPSVERLTGG